MFNDPVELTPQRSSPRPPVHPSSYKGHFLDRWSEMVDTYMCLLGSSPLDFHLTSTDRVHRPYTSSIYWWQQLQYMWFKVFLQCSDNISYKFYLLLPIYMYPVAYDDIHVHCTLWGKSVMAIKVYKLHTLFHLIPNIHINMASYFSDKLWLLFLYICLIALFPK